MYILELKIKSGIDPIRRLTEIRSHQGTIVNPYTNLKRYYLSNWQFTHALDTQQLYMAKT
jgi:hypothetical protein